MEKGSLIVISGPSGAGKGTICKSLLKKNSGIKFSISTTTRSIRANEIDGIDYHFVNKEKFEEMIKNDEFLEYAIYNNNYYGTSKKSVLKNLEEGFDVLLEIEIQGASIVKDKMKEGIFVFIMPPNMKTLIKRLGERGTETKEVIVERFKRAYQEINEVNNYNYLVINDNIDDAVEKVEAIILAEKCSIKRIDDFDLNNQEELIHEFLEEKES